MLEVTASAQLRPSKSARWGYPIRARIQDLYRIGAHDLRSDFGYLDSGQLACYCMSHKNGAPISMGDEMAAVRDLADGDV